jgi:hypothetical protein
MVDWVVNISVGLGSTLGLTSLTTCVGASSEDLRKGPKEMSSMR